MQAYALDKYENVCESTLRYIYVHESGEVVTKESFKEKLKNAATAIWDTIMKWIKKVCEYVTRFKNWILKHWNAFVAKFKGKVKVPNMKKTEEANKLADKAVTMIVQQQQKDLANVTAQANNQPEVKSDNFYEAIDEVLDEVAKLNQEAAAEPEEKDAEGFKQYMQVAEKQANASAVRIKKLEGVYKISKNGKKTPLQSKADHTLKLSAQTVNKAVVPIKSKSKTLEDAEGADFATLTDDVDDGYEGTAV